MRDTSDAAIIKHYHDWRQILSSSGIMNASTWNRTHHPRYQLALVSLRRCLRPPHPRNDPTKPAQCGQCSSYQHRGNKSILQIATEGLRPTRSRCKALSIQPLARWSKQAQSVKSKYRDLIKITCELSATIAGLSKLLERVWKSIICLRTSWVLNEFRHYRTSKLWIGRWNALFAILRR